MNKELLEKLALGYYSIETRGLWFLVKDSTGAICSFDKTEGKAKNSIFRLKTKFKRRLDKLNGVSNIQVTTNYTGNQNY